ncbi:MAG: hypothetical protein WDO18_10285 [Acidobacteriota bacterium]
MTCSECELQIFDGELDREALVHVAACEECRKLDREVRLNGSALAALREDELPMVRAQRRWPWVAAAAAAVLVTIALMPREKPPVRVAVVRPPLAAPALPPIAMPTAPMRKRAKRAAKPAPVNGGMIQIFTDDPEVVIYLVPDSIEGEQAL